MPCGTWDNPTYAKPPAFHKALSEMVGIPYAEVPKFLEEIPDFNRSGLYGLLTPEEVEEMLREGF
jgi:hypothetical protein